MTHERELSDDELDLLERFEHSFGVIDYPDETPPLYLVVDAECTPVVECKDPKVAALVAKLLTQFFYENWKP